MNFERKRKSGYGIIQGTNQIYPSSPKERRLETALSDFLAEGALMRFKISRQQTVDDSTYVTTTDACALNSGEPGDALLYLFATGATPRNSLSCMLDRIEKKEENRKEIRRTYHCQQRCHEALQRHGAC